jgi:hypothetical protein
MSVLKNYVRLRARVKPPPPRWPKCATCGKPLRLWQGGYGLEGLGRFCSVLHAVAWAHADERAHIAASGKHATAQSSETQ